MLVIVGDIVYRQQRREDVSDFPHSMAHASSEATAVVIGHKLRKQKAHMILRWLNVEQRR